jgi:hypothetical protein
MPAENRIGGATATCSFLPGLSPLGSETPLPHRQPLEPAEWYARPILFVGLGPMYSIVPIAARRCRSRPAHKKPRHQRRAGDGWRMCHKIYRLFRLCGLSRLPRSGKSGNRLPGPGRRYQPPGRPSLGLSCQLPLRRTCPHTWNTAERFGSDSRPGFRSDRGCRLRRSQRRNVRIWPCGPF